MNLISADTSYLKIWSQKIIQILEIEIDTMTFNGWLI